MKLEPPAGPSQADPSRKRGILCAEELVGSRASATSGCLAAAVIAVCIPARFCHGACQRKIPKPKSGATDRPKPNWSPESPQEEPEGFIIGVNVDLVVMHTSVCRQERHFVSGLKKIISRFLKTASNRTSRPFRRRMCRSAWEFSSTSAAACAARSRRSTKLLWLLSGPAIPTTRCFWSVSTMRSNCFRTTPTISTKSPTL